MLSTTIDTIQEVGIDYITCTSKLRKSDSSLAAFGSYLVGLEVESGEREAVWRGHGYHGRHAGQVAYGRRHDTEIVKLSGELASAHWATCLNLSSNVSRLDLQVTVKPAEGSAKRLQRHHREVLRANKGKGRPAGFKCYYGPDGPECLTLGSRTSDVFGRFYDKWVESCLPYYAGCLRYEMELKRKRALAMAQHLDRQPDEGAAIAAEVLKFARARNTQLSIEVDPATLTCGRPANDNESRKQGGRAFKRIMWIENSIKPAVLELVQVGLMQECLVALGISDLVQVLPTVPQAWQTLTSKEVH